MLLVLHGSDKMLGKRMTIFTMALLFVGVFCFGPEAFGSLFFDNARLSSEEKTCNAQVPSEVVFIDPSVPEKQKIVSQLPRGVEVVLLSPEMDGVAQISEHLEKKRKLSAIHIISHGNAGHFVLNGKRIDGEFLRDHGDLIRPWGRSLADDGDILLYACDLAASNEGKAFLEHLVDLTGADVAASTDATGGTVYVNGITYEGNWRLEFATGSVETSGFSVDSSYNHLLRVATWDGGALSTDWGTAANWDSDLLPVAGTDSIVIGYSSGYDPVFNGNLSYIALTINAGATLTVSSGTFSVSGASYINGTLSIATGTYDANGAFDAAYGTVAFTGTGNLKLASTVTSLGSFTPDNGTVTYDGAGSQTVFATSDPSYNRIAFGGTGTKTAYSLIATTLSAPSGAYSIALNGNCEITDVCTFSNTGTLVLGDSLSSILIFDGGVTATAPSSVTLTGMVRTSGDAIIIGDADTGITLAEDATLDTTIGETPTSADVTLGGTVNGTADNTQSLTLNAGTGGTISVTGAIGGAAGKQIKTLTITNSNGATFTDAVTADTSVILEDTSNGANITFTGALVTQALTTATKPYNLDLHGSGTIITNAVTFTNTGALALGNAAGDTLLFNGGLTATTPSGVTLNGQVRTSGDTISIGDAGTGVTIAGTTSVLDSTNNGGTTSGGTITVGGTVNGTTVNAQSLTVNGGTGGTATFSDIGLSTAVKTFTLTNGTFVIADKNIITGTLTVNGGTFGHALSPSGIWDVGDVTIAAGATMNATTGAFTVSGNWANSGTFNHKNRTVTLDGTNQSISGSTTFYNLEKNIETADTLTFQNGTANKTIVANTLQLQGGSGALLSLRSASAGSQWEIDPQGTRTIAYLDVKDSKNVNTTAINAVGTNSADSGNNTNWTFATPTITSFSPKSGGTGTSVTITGTNFTGTTAVTFGGTDSSNFTVKSNTEIIAVVAGGATGAVAVTTPEGTVASNTNFTYTAVITGTYYVNISTGNDSNDGSSALPWKTLHHAITQINGGTAGTYVLHVALGTYNVSSNTREADEEIVLSQSDVTIIGESGSAPIIDGTGAQNWINGIEITGSYVTIENLYFTGFTGTEETGIKISSGSESSNNEVRKCRFYGNDRGIWVNYSNGTTIRNCEIYQNTTHGIDITWSTGQVVVGNKVYNNPQYGIRAQCSPEISRNLIYDNVYGIMVEANGTGDDSSPTIKNNVIYKTASGAMSYGIYTLASNGLADPEIYHNTIDSGTISGITTEKTGGSSGPNIRYNIITNFDQYGIQNIGTSPTINYNNVWNNTAGNYEGCTAGANDLDPPGNPLYVTGSYSLHSTSPCIGTIPSGDPVTLDYPGFKRPLSGKTMGAYEYVADVTNNYTLPGGTGVSTDYRIFTIPLELGTGADMLTAMENVLGAYDPVHWRAFLFNGTSYNEFNSTQFASHTIKPGMGFWIITTYTDVIPFKGQPAPDGVDYVMDLGPGWHLIGLPWVDTNIFLSSIKVTDGVYTYALSDMGNNLTQKILWDFTGDGPFSGYEKRSAVGFRLQNNKGYFFKVLSSTPIRMIIPNAANLAQNAPVDMLSNQTNTNEDDETPPPPPGAEPIPDIKANGQDGPVVLNAGDSVAVSVSMDPGVWNGRNADWWVAAHTPFASPWYTYVYPEGWKSGIQACVQMPLFELSGPINVLNMVLPTGSYTFYFAVDGNMDGKPDVTWMDSVQVSVE